MSARLMFHLKGSHPSSIQSTPISSYLLPFLYTQRRAASILSNLSDNRTAYNKKIRRGRGPSSGKGKTSGRGNGGQKARGKVPKGFNGGQTKLEIVHGIRGFDNAFSENMVPINLDRIQAWIDQGRIDPSRPITIKELADSRCATNIKDGVKLLARGSEALRSPLNIIISRASGAAIAAIEAAGGSVTTRYYTPFSIQRILRGKTDPINSLLSRGMVQGSDPGEAEKKKRMYLNRLPDPTSRKDIEYYRDPAHRGYLSYQLGKGQGPSLYHKAPWLTKFRGKKSKPKVKVEALMW